VILHTHLIVRDDALQLYGFATEEERSLFLLLLGVQSVGPKMALGVLSGGPPRELTLALAAGDTARFQAVPGIGKRTAERIVVELRDKVDDGPIVISRGSDESPHALARDGLVELGFAAAEAEKLLSRADGESVEELIGAALRGARR
jgi:holliday junction DNA helicase RuvA